MLVTAGQESVLDVASAVEPAGFGRAYSVAGATFVQAQIDGESGQLRVSAPMGTTGRQVLLLSVADDRGRVATTTLEVLVSSATIVNALRLLRLPDVIIAAGTDLDVDLDPFAEGAQGEIHWSATVVGDLVLAVVDGGQLRLRAGAHGGRATILLVALDEAGRRASELLQVQVDVHTHDTQAPIRLMPPTALTLPPGGRQGIDLRSLVEGDAAVLWSITEDAGFHVEFSGDTLYVEADPLAAAGWRQLTLQALTTAGTVSLRFDVAVTALPTLALRSPSDITVVAGRITEPLDLDSLVSVGDSEHIDWSIGGGVRLAPTLTVERRLRIDAVAAVPGREVLLITATLGGELRHLSVSVTVRAPAVALTPPDTLRLTGSEAAVLLDGWVNGEVDPSHLRWRVTGSPAGIAASWDETSRRLRLAGAGSGIVSLQALLSSGLQVATMDLAVRFQVEPGAEPAPLAEPEEVPEPWSLRQPPLTALAAKDTVRVPLALLVTGAAVGDLVWSVQAENGQARIVAAQLELSGAADFRVVIEASHRLLLDDVLRLELLVTVQPTPAAAPPQVALTWDLLDGERPSLAVRVEADSDVDLRLDVTIQGQAGQSEFAQSQQVRAGEPVLLPLPAGPARIEIFARGQRAGAVGEASACLQGGWLMGSAELSDPDGVLVVGVPAGISGGLAVVLARADEVGAIMVTRTGAAAALSIRAPDGMQRWSSLQQRTETGWRDVPGSRRTASGVRAFTDSQPGTAVYRPVAAEGTDPPAAVRPGPFPNPFNASVTLPVDVDQEGTLRIYDATGRVVRAFVVRSGDAVHWNGRDDDDRAVASGVYFYRMETATPSAPRGKLTLLR